MREIKFRGYDKLDKKMYSPQSFERSHYALNYQTDKVALSFFGMQNAKHFILMQYTGLKDKNGKEIYEGDVCEFIISVSDSYPREKLIEMNGLKVYLYKIEIKNLTLGFSPLFPDFVHPDDKEWKPFYQEEDVEFWDTKYFEIIGNIYENPELLKEQP